MGYIGHGAFIPYLTNWIHGKKEDVGLVRRIFIGSLNREIPHLSEEYDLLISHFHHFYLKNYFSNLFIRIPDFVRQTIELPNNRADLHKKIKTRESQKDLNKVKRKEFTREITKNKKIFKFFYDEFYLPFITSRHGDYAYILPYETLVPTIEEGELLMVKQGGQYVSGVLCRKQGSIYETILSGVYRGDWDLVQNGALAAEYFFSMERAIDLGCKIIDFGPTRGFLNDGILHFKKKWNAQTSIDHKSAREIGLHICKFNKGTCEFLEKNPFLSVAGGHLRGTIILGESTNLADKELQSYIKCRRFKGVGSMIIVLLSESWISRKAMLQEISNTLTEDVRIIEYPPGNGSNFVTLIEK